ncbi:MAG: T9SS type A sorting domain-containing protein [Ignavibacteriae bacterium]|nr:T9SS type A sorting domain-containing protein [Ignavibacteriota bacterium]
MKKGILIKLYIVFLTLLILLPLLLSAADGDTLKLRTIEFGQTKNGKYIFPPATERFERILMNYKLKCPCGEWDYIANVFVEQYYAPSFRINYRTQDTARFMLDTSWNYTSGIVGSNLVIDSTPKTQVLLKFYNDQDYPTKTTDSMWVWQEYYTYTFDAQGNKTDSTLVQADSTIYLTRKRVYFSDSVTITDRFEIMRYITPYGNGLSLGAGFNWVIDISDFEPFLHDTVFINAPNGQEALELTFDFIKGVPPRDVVRLERIYDVFANYNKNFELRVPPKQVQFTNDDKMARLKIIQTGHAMNVYDGCSEFCRKQAFVKINGTQRYDNFIWRDDCGRNPVYPQNGTWNLMRSNWCPGAEVRYYDYELTPYITPGQASTIDYDMEYYDAPIVGSGYVNPEWRITGYIITYSSPNFSNDAALVNIIAPNNNPFYRRFNPIANNPRIIIKNNGGNLLTSLDIDYGIINGNTASYHWTGNLKITDTAIVTLPNFDWGDLSNPDRKFFAEVSNPNGAIDEYLPNNRVETGFNLTPIYYNDLIIEYKTNKYAKEQYNYTLRKLDGTLINFRDNMEDYTLYRDTFNLEDGEYEFIFRNVEGYGINHWFFRDNQGWGAGYVNLINRGNVIDFNDDFGTEIFHQFRVAPKPGILVSIDTLKFGNVKVGESKFLSFDIYPVNSKGVDISRLQIIFGDKKGYFISSTEPPLGVDPIHIDSGSVMTVTIEFKPPKEGIQNSTLNIINNDDLNSTYTVKLTGFGTDPNSVRTNSDELLILEISQNPISTNAEIKFGNDNFVSSKARLVLYNSLGQLVKLLYDGLLDDIHSLNLSADGIDSGIYYMALTMDGKTLTKPVVVVK